MGEKKACNRAGDMAIKTLYLSNIRENELKESFKEEGREANKIYKTHRELKRKPHPIFILMVLTVQYPRGVPIYMFVYVVHILNFCSSIGITMHNRPGREYVYGLQCFDTQSI